MKPGIYEKIINLALSKAIDEYSFTDIRNVDKSEVPKVISLAYERMIRQILAEKKHDDRLEFIKKLNELMEQNDFLLQDNKFRELLSLHNDKEEFERLKKYRPKTSIATSSLFTGNNGPSLESELKREIRTADEIDFLVAFIKFSGLRLIYDELKEFTKDKKLRIITTSYMAASEYKAIMELAKLPNTEIRISYDKSRTRLHAKAYYFKRHSGFSTAYIGSSNLSNPALSNGLEWNVKLSEYTSRDVLDNLRKSFESYWNDDEFKIFSPTNKEDKEELRQSLSQEMISDKPYVFFDLQPYSHQKEILEDLSMEREEYGSFKNLIVAATGTGKTMVAAFDYKRQIKDSRPRLLFLAHRKEILEQSLHTFRNVLKDQNFGELWVSDHRPEAKDHIFASIQTMNSNSNYMKYPKDYFDYIVIDETHHAAAASYLRIIEYFEAKILLGLTATPERMDGQNILEYFNNRIASEIRLAGAINRRLLCPFHYFGVTDSEDLSHLKWSRGGYDISELENLFTKSKQRVQVILNAIDRYLSDSENFKALGFCVSIAHADFMANAFNKAGLASIALHSQSEQRERNEAKRKLQTGEIKCIFTVDLFNEGVDIPDIDTVFFLRPTESLTIFIQQLGRGLRLAEGKELLTVLDFVGQAHANYDFSFKFRALTGKTNRSIQDEINDEFPNMPAGCNIKLERVAQDYILKNIQSSTFNIRTLRGMLINYPNNFSNELNLSNFLTNYGLERDRFFARYSFYELVAEVSNRKYQVQDRDELRNALRRFTRINSKRLLEFSKNLLQEDIDLNKFNDAEKLMLGMFHYTLWGVKPQLSYLESLQQLKKFNPDMVKELLAIIDYNKGKMRTKTIEYEDPNIPLDVYASYSVQQIMVAFGKTTENHVYPMREGVLYIEDKHTDLLFITLNKQEEDYLPSTMYNDYAISSELFNWESQSTTSLESPTGQRYINAKDKKHKVLIFVRENKTEFGQAPPYIFLGNACYLSHRGSRPIEIVWKMDRPIPERIIRESHLRISGS